MAEAPPLRIVRFQPGGERPLLRPVEAVPVDSPEGKRFVLRDPSGLADTTLLVSPDALAVAALMDGVRTVPDIQRELLKSHDVDNLVYSDRIVGLARMLDQHGFLDSDTFRAKKRRAVEEYRALAARPARHAGAAYPRDPKELEERIASFFPAAEPKVPAPQAPKKLAALVAPHIDLHRGGPAYGHAYKALAEGTDADLFVIFGTAHASPNHLFTLTTKDYDTPLGPVPTDRALVEALCEKLGPGLLAEELAHKTEHSIEFQALFLKSLGREVKLLPVLTSSLYDCKDPLHDDRVQKFLDALAEAVRGRNVCYIAAADLSHVGRMFGDKEGPSQAALTQLGQRDRRSLALCCAGDFEAFFHDVRPDVDSRRICGLTPIYMTLRASRARQGTLLHYGQWAADGSSVTYAAVALY